MWQQARVIKGQHKDRTLWVKTERPHNCSYDNTLHFHSNLSDPPLGDVCVRCDMVELLSIFEEVIPIITSSTWGIKPEEWELKPTIGPKGAP